MSSEIIIQTNDLFVYYGTHSDPGSRENYSLGIKDILNYKKNRLLYLYKYNDLELLLDQLVLNPCNSK